MIIAKPCHSSRRLSETIRCCSTDLARALSIGSAIVLSVVVQEVLLEVFAGFNGGRMAGAVVSTVAQEDWCFAATVVTSKKPASLASTCRLGRHGRRAKMGHRF